MLLVEDFNQIALNADDLIAAGYGVSVLNGVDVDEPYDRDVIIEVLADWGCKLSCWRRARAYSIRSRAGPSAASFKL